MTILRLVYLVLAVVGAILPMRYFMRWLNANDGDFGGMIAAWFVNDSSTGLVYDLTIAAVTLTVWILSESLVRRDYLSLIAIPATFGIGVSCGLPLYLFLRSRMVG